MSKTKWKYSKFVWTISRNFGRRGRKPRKDSFKFPIQQLLLKAFRFFIQKCVYELETISLRKEAKNRIIPKPYHKISCGPTTRRRKITIYIITSPITWIIFLFWIVIIGGMGLVIFWIIGLLNRRIFWQIIW